MKKLIIILLVSIVGWSCAMAQSFGDKIIENNSFKMVPSYGDFVMRRYIDNDMIWKRALVPTPSKLIINCGNDFKEGIVIGGNIQVLSSNNEGILIGKYQDKLGWDGTGGQPGYHIRFAGYRDVSDSYSGARISALRTNYCCDAKAQGMELAFYTSNLAKDKSNGDVNLTEAMRINANSNIAIGKTKADYKLDVAGTIRADEIRVEDIAASNLNLSGNIAANNITVKANGNTADFVFADDYQLKDLKEVEAYIKEHKCLPEIPNAETMEEQGVNLAEMNKLLLQKVEELTLYVIEKDKKIEKLEGERSAEKEERKAIEDRLTKIERMLKYRHN